jgi:hypothetical protein
MASPRPDHKPTEAKPSTTFTPAEAVQTLRNLHLCDGQHTKSVGVARSCRDCLKALSRDGAMLLLAILPTASSLGALVESAQRFRRSYPLAWPHLDIGYVPGVVNALRMSNFECFEVAEYIHLVDGIAKAAPEEKKGDAKREGQTRFPDTVRAVAEADADFRAGRTAPIG